MIGLAVVLDFFNCGASMSSSADAFLFVTLASTSLDFFTFGSSSDSSAIRLLPLRLGMVGWASAEGVIDLRARVEALDGAGADPAATAFFGGMLTELRQRANGVVRSDQKGCRSCDQKNRYECCGVGPTNLCFGLRKLLARERGGMEKVRAFEARSQYATGVPGTIIKTKPFRD